MELNVTYDTLHSLANRLMYDQRSFADLLPEEATFWLAWTFSAEVQNGGLHQFFFNHSGDYAHGTIDALREVAAFEMAEALRAGIAFFASGKVDPDTIARRKQLEVIDADAFRALDDICFSMSDRLDTLLIAYVKSKMLKTIIPDFLRAASDKAAEHFRLKNYSQVVELLSPFEGYLDGSILGKLKLSRKKIIDNTNS